MNKKIFFGLAVFVLAVILSGCGKSISQQVGEQMAENAIESSTGGKADVDINQGDVTIKTEEGESQYSASGEAKLPEGFPKELVVADDAKIIISSSAAGGMTVSYTTASEQAVIFEKYKTDLADSGWKKEVEVDSGDSGKMASFSKDKNNASVTINENSSEEQDGKTIVSVVFVKAENTENTQTE